MLLVVLDTVRADVLTPYGSTRDTTPQLQAIADAGVVFEDVTSVGSWTWPSHASLFTGEPPWVHGAHFAPPAEGGMQVGPDPFHASALRDDLPTLAERFNERGYRTVSLSANRLIAWDFGLARGFSDARTFETDAALARAATQLLDQAPSDRPLLLFINLFGAHAPFEIQPVSWLKDRPELQPDTAPAWLQPYLRLDGQRINLFRSPSPGEPIGIFAYMRGELDIPPAGLQLLREIYEGEVAAVDYQLHTILERWNATRGTRGIVAITSDHGEFLGERQLMEHGRSVYPELVQVPLVIAAPGRLPAGARVSEPIQVHDLHDMLLSLSAPDRPESLVDLAQTRFHQGPILAAAYRDHFWAGQAGERFSQGYRLYREAHEAVIFGTQQGIEYYDLSRDPAMSRDRAQEQLGRAKALQARASPLFDEAAPTTPAPVPAEALEQLRALGYIGD